MIASILFAGVSSDSLDYKINKGDVISINVMDHPEFSYGLIIVMPDGFIQYPGIGSINIAGTTMNDLRDNIYSVVSQYVPNPLITVNVSKIYNHNINVLGFVNQQGSYQIYEPVDIMFALSLAGGIKEPGNSRITIFHSDGTIETTRLKTLLKTGNVNLAAPRIKVYPYDTIVIEQTGKVNWPFITFCMTAVSLFTNIYFRTN
jgi:polysaccharide export outer membrane protein